MANFVKKTRQYKIMYSKEEAKRIKLEFWLELGNRFSEIKGLHANKVNWLNFNTKIKNLYFRMEVDEHAARLCIDLQFPDLGIRELYYDQFLEFQDKLNKQFTTTVNWQPKHQHWNGKQIARIAVDKEGVNILNKADWETIFTFLTTHFSQLEHFWAEFGDVFVELKN